MDIFFFSIGFQLHALKIKNQYHQVVLYIWRTWEWSTKLNQVEQVNITKSNGEKLKEEFKTHDSYCLLPKHISFQTHALKMT